MNRNFSLLAVSLFLLSAACKKDSPGTDGNGPDVVLPTDGFLVTMGKNKDNHMDTLAFWFSTNGQELTVYDYGYGRPQDEISMNPNSNNTVTIQKKVPYMHNNKPYKWFGIDENKNPDFSSFPLNQYLFDMFHEAESAKTQFIIKRKDGDMEKFTIESKAFPGYYLGCAKWKNATYPTETRLVFTTKAQEFWFMQK